jgi:hypothetical protein
MSRMKEYRDCQRHRRSSCSCGAVKIFTESDCKGAPLFAGFAKGGIRGCLRHLQQAARIIGEEGPVSVGVIVVPPFRTTRERVGHPADIQYSLVSY